MSGIIGTVGSKSHLLGKIILAKDSTPHFQAYGNTGTTSTASGGYLPLNQATENNILNNGWDTTNYYFVPPTNAEGLWWMGVNIWANSANGARYRWAITDTGGTTDGYFGDASVYNGSHANNNQYVSGIHLLNSGSQIGVKNIADDNAAKTSYFSFLQHTVLCGVYLG